MQTLFGRHFRQISGRSFRSFLSVKLDANAVNPNLPIGVIESVLEVAKNRNRNMKFRQLVFAYRTEPTVLKGAGIAKRQLYYPRV